MYILPLSLIPSLPPSLLDCGAGIGRTTKNLLCPQFQSVDYIEPTPKFVEKARENLKDFKTMGRFYPIGIQDWMYVRLFIIYFLFFCFFYFA